jgi:phospholipid/cholesterol/gamma-HCH transport system substrate-binding protein
VEGESERGDVGNEDERGEDGEPMGEAERLERKGGDPGEEEKASPARKALYVAAIALAAFAGWMILTSDSEYVVTGEFENASQLVPGNEVVVGGVPVGTVKTIELGPNGTALVSFTVGEEHAPLHRGTVATVRSYSLSGLANRQVQLTLPPDSRAGEVIESDGTLTQSETVSEVDLDEVFNTLDKQTVADFKRVIKGFELSYDGVGKQANEGFKYANPFLSTSRGLFAELTYDERALENLIVDTSKLSGALAQRAPDISALVGNLNTMMGAIGRQKLALAEAIGKLPDFMRNANTTFVNLRAALDDVDPLVDASYPAVEELGPFIDLLRPTIADAVPTIRDLDAIVKRRGESNDLVELTRDQVSLARRAIGSGAPDCGGGDLSVPENGAANDDFSEGAFGETVCALTNGNPTLAMFRPYTPDLVNWFDDFSHPGTFDALGGIGRIGTSFNQFTLSAAGLPDLGLPVDPNDLIGPAGTLQNDLDSKCPGTGDRPIPDGLITPGNPEDGIPFVEANVNCDPNDVLRQP